jgi:hypothetical protein
MPSEERLSGPNVPQRPDRADEVERRDDMVPNNALFPAPEIARLRNQWTEIQSGFVDEPRNAVKGADSLVGEVLKSLSETFAKERARLESQWDHDGDVTTEDFRVALRRYRTFFDRLLSI